MSIFEAAGSNDLIADWLTSTVRTPSEAIAFELTKLRDRSRDLANNHSQIQGYFRRLVRNVVGVRGVDLQPGRGRKQAIKRRWNAWGKKRNCTLDQSMSLREVQGFVIESVARDGEAFVQKVIDQQQLRLVPLDAAQIDITKRDPSINLDMGIQLDSVGRPVAYHMIDRDEPIPAIQMCHIFRRQFAGQRRGIPWLHAAMVDAHHLREYRESELVAARIGANKIGFYTDQSGTAGQDDKKDLPTEVSAPGTLHALPPGVGFEAFDPQRPTNAFEVFESSILRGIASSVGASYVSLANDLRAVSYSSIRQGTLDEREMYEEAQAFLAEHFLEDIYSVWRFANDLPPDEEATWVGRGWPWVDPRAEVEAARLEVEAGFNSRRNIIISKGRDPEEIAAQIAEEGPIQGQEESNDDDGE